MAAAVKTPWGDATKLRERMLQPGLRVPAEEVAQNQRERLFAAMVASCAERGYERTSVADLIDLSGVSRAAFYELFENKGDCFKATTEALMAAAISLVSRAYQGSGPWEERARAALGTLLELAAAQPAAARLCLVEAYAAGPAGLEPLDRAVDQLGVLGRQALEQIPGRSGVTEELSRAIIGGFHTVLYERLHSHRESELPGLTQSLWDWSMSYSTPPAPLRARLRRPPEAERAVAQMPPFALLDPPQRIIRAFADVLVEKRYADVSIADIVTAASISHRTFYEYFEGKRDLLLAALDSSGAQMIAATLPAVRRAPDWPRAARAAFDATCKFLATEPGFARLRVIEVYAAGPEAIAQRNRAGLEVLEAVLSPAFERTPEVNPIALEAILGAAYTVLTDRLRSDGPEGLPRAAPLMTYVTLAPFLGAEEACEVANDDGRRR
jgi:AcrR family transcriptional regulator